MHRLPRNIPDVDPAMLLAVQKDSKPKSNPRLQTFSPTPKGPKGSSVWRFRECCRGYHCAGEHEVSLRDLGASKQ